MHLVVVDREQFRFAAISERVQHGQRANVVDIQRHVGIEYDLCRLHGTVGCRARVSRHGSGDQQAN